jgi:hypothetical protein
MIDKSYIFESSKEAFLNLLSNFNNDVVEYNKSISESNLKLSEPSPFKKDEEGCTTLVFYIIGEKIISHNIAFYPSIKNKNIYKIVKILIDYDKTPETNTNTASVYLWVDHDAGSLDSFDSIKVLKEYPQIISDKIEGLEIFKLKKGYNQLMNPKNAKQRITHITYLAWLLYTDKDGIRTKSKKYVYIENNRDTFLESCKLLYEKDLQLETYYSKKQIRVGLYISIVINHKFEDEEICKTISHIHWVNDISAKIVKFLNRITKKNIINENKKVNSIVYFNHQNNFQDTILTNNINDFFTKPLVDNFGNGVIDIYKLTTGEANLFEENKLTVILDKFH